VWQKPHFATGFCEKTVVFWAAFFGAGFDSIRAKGDKIAGDGQEHFIDESGDDPGFVISPGDGVGKLAQGVQGSLEGDAAQIDVVGEGGLLHEAADKVERRGRSFILTHLW